MANTYCVATNTGKGFFTSSDRNAFYLSGHAGDVWVVGNNAAGVSWINRVNGTAKVKADAQAIVDGKTEEAQTAWDALPEAEKAQNDRPEKYTLPQELTMANYKGIKGFKVQSLASDPTANEGQIWYNNASYALKYDTVGAGAWSAGGSLNTARVIPGGTGIQTAALCFGGNEGPPVEITDKSESYNGSTWTEGNNLTTARQSFTGFGTQTASFAISGLAPGPSFLTNVESYDGTCWTETTDVNTAKVMAGAAGTTAAGIWFGGEPAVATTEQWNGTTWTEVNTLASNRSEMASFGTNTAALSVGGNTPPTVGIVEEWDGTSWTEVGDLTTARRKLAGSGSTTAAIVAGGATALAVAELYDGSTWTEVADLATGRANLASGKTSPSTLSIVFAGTPPYTGATEEWNGAPATVKR